MKNDDKWTAGDVALAVILGVCGIVAAPVIIIAHVGTKILEKLGVENTPIDDANPYDM